jgi:hypothetical protein
MAQPIENKESQSSVIANDWRLGQSTTREFAPANEPSELSRLDVSPPLWF